MESKSKLRILIVEDELVVAASLEENLNDLGYTDIQKARNSQTALELFQKQDPNIAILDIRLNGSELDGIGIAKSFNSINKIPLIFLSSYDDTDTRERAKQVNPSAFLIKPASIRQIDIAIDFALNHFYREEKSPSPLKSIVCPLGKQPEYIFIKGQLSYEKVSIHEITVIQAAASSCQVNTLQKKYIISTNLSNLLQQITHPDLVRVHRSYAINLTHLKAFDEHDVYIIHQNEVLEIPIGNAYKANLIDQLPKIRTAR